jgi:hypothetical protein
VPVNVSILRSGYTARTFLERSSSGGKPPSSLVTVHQKLVPFKVPSYTLGDRLWSLLPLRKFLATQIITSDEERANFLLEQCRALKQRSIAVMNVGLALVYTYRSGTRIWLAINTDRNVPGAHLESIRTSIKAIRAESTGGVTGPLGFNW